MYIRRNISKRLVTAIFGLAIIVSTNMTANADNDAVVMVFAAASTTEAIKKINFIYKNEGQGHAISSFASSSTLAKQIARGAPADIFLSANPQWMAYLDEKKLIDRENRYDLLSNRIVLIGPASTNHQNITVVKGFPIAELLGKGRLAMGDPTHVPAGIYGKQALVSLGVWESVADKIAPARDVRSALVLVEREETPLGVVYATDAAVTLKVRILGSFPSNCHPAIVYPVALIAGRRNPTSLHYINFLRSQKARKVFESYGFSIP